MTTSSINTAIDRIVSDVDLRDEVVKGGSSALAPFDLEPAEAAALTDALRADDGAEPFENLRRQARFEPLFAAASASATKVG